MIIPRAKKEIYKKGILDLSAGMPVYKDSSLCDAAIFAIQHFVPFMPVTAAASPDDARLIFRKTELSKKGAYNLYIDEKITVEYADTEGARNAISSLGQLIGTGFKAPYCEISDYPDNEIRSFLIDLARGVGNKDDIRENIIRLALMKYTRIHFHLSDSEGFAWQSKKHPALHGPFGDQHSMTYLRSLNDFCTALGLEVLPEVEIPGHSATILEAYKNLKCLDPEGDDWALCAGNEGIYELYNDLISEVVEMFPSSEYIHIGGDEVDMSDLRGMSCSWQKCDCCAKLNLPTMQEKYFYVIKRAYDIVKAHGKKVTMWSDFIDISKPCPLPKDILMQFWRVAAPGRGPVEGCSMQKFAEQGYKIINSFFEEVYFCEQEPTEESLCRWTPLSSPEIDGKYADYVVGGEGCAWNFGYRDQRFYRYTLPTDIGLLSDRLWNNDKTELTPEFRRAMTRATLGINVPSDFDLYELIGSVYLRPDNNKLGSPENTEATKEELNKAILTLVDTLVTRTYGERAAIAYIECLNYVKAFK